MTEQIITLGIGGTPTSLTSFITTGLEIGEVVAAIATVSLTVRGRLTSLTTDNRGLDLTTRSRTIDLTVLERE